MKERPILFSAPMVQAILDGRKTQTRRIVKGASIHFCDLNGMGNAVFTEDEVTYKEVKNRYGDVGDRLWVRETGWMDKEPCDKFRDAPPHRRFFYEDGWVRHEHDGSMGMAPFLPSKEVIKVVGLQKRVPSIHMPRWASRLTLEVVNVRVERLTQIKQSDAIEEGITWDQDHDYVGEFRELWESINGDGSWEENPWVWAVEFKMV